ncbi:ABC transporter permease [Prosthecochloris sp. HL-130-GSB]|uniref:ABC transporter permease n=1 Tax=Prosthecochloris sp. HL-130-GSB TaxID=1974213 RepID=UPI0035131A80
MKLRELIKQAMRSLQANLLRSTLTTTGVAVGVFSIIAVMTALQAIDKSVSAGLSSLGANTFEIQKYPATFIGGMEETNLSTGRISHMKKECFSVTS